MSTLEPRCWKDKGSFSSSHAQSRLRVIYETEASFVRAAAMAEEDGYGVMDDLDFDWLYVEDDYPLSVCVSVV